LPVSISLIIIKVDGVQVARSFSECLNQLTDKWARSRMKSISSFKKIGGLVGGIVLVVLGALMIAEGVIGIMGSSGFFFISNMNRGFEFVVGLVTIVTAGISMSLSRN
jgi:hypothetical protein